MLSFRKRCCALCGALVPTKRTFRAPDRMNSFVCLDCFERWEREGRRCAQCQDRVTGVQDVGAFLEQQALGHADCGGLRLFAA